MNKDIAMYDAAILDALAPCGLDCSKCLAFAGGEIRRHSQALAALLGANFASYAKRMSPMAPALEHYHQFRMVLDYLADATCQGCRKSGCLFKDCHVHACVKEKGVDFCFQCSAFPCHETNFPPALEERWFKNNQRMREQGVEIFYLMVKDKPRYP